MFGGEGAGAGNNREFQKGLDADDMRRRRQDDRLSLRKKIRQQHFNKRRKQIRQTGGDNSGLATGQINSGVDAENDTIPGSNNRMLIPPHVKVDNLPRFVQQVNNKNFEDVFEGVQCIRQLLSVEDRPPIKEVLNSGVVTALLKMMKLKMPQLPHGVNPNKPNNLQDQNPNSPAVKQRKLQFEAAWAVTNIASGDREFTIALCKENAIDAFIHLLKNTDQMETADQCIWGLGNIAGDCAQLRDMVLQTDTLDWILGKLFQFPISMQRNAVWTLSNFCRGKPSPTWLRVKKILTPLKNLLSTSKDYDIIVDILWALSFLSEDRQDAQGRPIDPNGNPIDPNSADAQEAYQVTAVIDSGVVQYIVHLITHANEIGTQAFRHIQEQRQKADLNEGGNVDIPEHIQQQMQTADFLIAPCVRTLGNIVSGTDQQTQAVVAAGFYSVIEICLQHRVKNIRKESCWALSNVVAGTQEQLEAFFKMQTLVKKVVDLARHGDINVRKEAGWCLSNAVCGASYQQVDLLVGCGFIEAMVGLLKLNHVEKVLLMSMEALDGCMSLWAKENNATEGESEFNAYVIKTEESGGLDMLEELQGLENVSERVCDQAAKLVKKWWGDSNDDQTMDANDESFGANVNSGGDAFAFGFNNSNSQNNNQNSNNGNSGGGGDQAFQF